MVLERIFLRKEWSLEKKDYNCYKIYIMKDQITKTIAEATGVLAAEIHLETSELPEHGDYSSNIALQAFTIIKSKKWPDGSFIGTRKYPSAISGKNPMEFANNIKNLLKKDKDLSKVVDKIEVASPGFINFWLSTKSLFDTLISINSQKDTFGKSYILKGKKIMVEYADPNPFKEFHIGHLRNITYGEAFCRLFEAIGARVWRVNYQGDVGMHVAKAIWGIKKLDSAPLDKQSLKEKASFLGKAYAVGSSAFEEDEKANQEIKDLNLKIYNKDPEILPIWEKGRKWSLDAFEEIYKRVETKYKRYYFESEVAQPGKDLVTKNTGMVFEKGEESAIIFPGEKYGLHTRVFITRDGYATYEAKDIALAPIKYSDFPYDLSFILTADEQVPYFKVVIKALSLVNPALGEKTKHLAFGFVDLKGEKMSSRKGNVITGESLLDIVREKVMSEYKTTKDLAEKIALGAVKYYLLKVTPLSKVEFDIKESISLEGNSGTYLQYTFARTQSVLKKAPNLQITKSPDKLEVNDEEALLLRSFVHFPEVIESAAKTYSPNLLCNYLYNLAQKFNLFYNRHRILEAPDPVLKLRLGLTSATGQILSTGLNLLGIQAPERM